MQVLKFGGTSVGTAETLERVLNIILEKNKTERVTVVVSALGGVTNQLEAALKDAVSGGNSWQAAIEKLRRRHAGIITAFVSAEEQSRLNSYLDRVVFKLIQTLAGVRLLREFTPAVRDRILVSGEYLSSELLAAALRSRGQAAIALDPTELIRTDSQHGNASVDEAETHRRIRALLGELPEQTVAVVGGFVGSTHQKTVTTLGRGGSDYSAALIAGALSAKRLEIWTDVDGVLNGDPRQLENTDPIPQLHYREAEQLSRLGAKVLHAKTIAPLVIAGGIPLHIRNTHRPDSAGTIISNHVTTPSSFRALTLQTNLSLLEIRAVRQDTFALLLADVFRLLAGDGKEILHYETNTASASLQLLVAESDAGSILEKLNEDLTNNSLALELKRFDGISRISLLSKTPLLPLEAIKDSLFGDEDGIRFIVHQCSGFISFVVDSENEKDLLKKLHAGFVNDVGNSVGRENNQNSLIQVGKAG